MLGDDPLVGRQLANFRIERQLGRGGMGQVYYGTDVKLQRPVAIKVIDTRYRSDASYARRFVNEARAVATWRHDHIIQVYYADDEDGLFYFVMEYIDGKDLAQLMADYAAEGELMPLTDVLRMGRAVASALDYAHSRNVIHRDVKPANVMVARDGRAVLGDFGLALDAQRGSVGEVFGTAHYIAPEQVYRSANAVPQSDLYSLGIILYELLTGVTPFDGETAARIALQQITLTPPPPRSLNPSLNVETEAVLLKALSKDPADRYQTGQMLMDALENALRAPATETPLPQLPLPPAAAAARPARPARPVSRVSVAEKVALGLLPPGAAAPPPRHSFRRGWWLALLGYFLIVLALGGGAFFWFSGGGPELNRSLLAWFSASATPTATGTLAPTATWLPASLTPTPSATRTRLPPTATRTATVTARSSVTPTVPATPTDTPTATATVSPTATLVVVLATETLPPTATATDSPTPTLTFTPSVTPSPTPLPRNQRFVVYYNYNSLYLLNLSAADYAVNPLAFERLSTSGAVLNRFEGQEWAKYEPVSVPKTCMRIEIKDSSPYLNPAECGGIYRSSRFPVRTSTLIFWTYTVGSREFRVVWNDIEVTRCAINKGVCEFYLP